MLVHVEEVVLEAWPDFDGEAGHGHSEGLDVLRGDELVLGADEDEAWREGGHLRCGFGDGRPADRVGPREDVGRGVKAHPLHRVLRAQDALGVVAGRFSGVNGEEWFPAAVAEAAGPTAETAAVARASAATGRKSSRLEHGRGVYGGDERHVVGFAELNDAVCGHAEGHRALAVTY